jgi:hypothetical protein
MFVVCLQHARRKQNSVRSTISSRRASVKKYFVFRKILLSVRAPARDAASVNDATERLFMAERVFEGKPFAGYGDVYRWLRENSDYVDEWLVKAKPSWATIAVTIGKAGVQAKNGQAPVGKTVRRIWQRVRRDLAIEAERRREQEAAEKAAAYERMSGVPMPKRQPSDFSRDWRPTEVGAPISSASAPQPEASRALVVGGGEMSPSDPANRTMAHRSQDLARQLLRDVSGYAKPKF